MSSEHAKLSPSASDRWLNCHVAPMRESKIPDKESKHAAEGTAAHSLAETILMGVDPKVDDPRWATYLSTEFKDYVMEYVDCVRAKIGKGELFVEQRLNIFPQYGVFGTADAVIVDDGVLRVVDLKGGTGIVVEAEDNTQLKMYAWGGLQSFEWLSSTPIARIEVTIKQPRRGHEATETFSADELRAWAAQVEPDVKAAYVGEGVGNPGSHCQWCRVKATCPERAAQAIAIAGMDFGDIGSTDCVPQEVEGLSEEQLVQIFLKIPLLEKYIKAVETHVADLAHERKVIGLKWVQGRATRTITNPTKASEKLGEFGINPWADPKLLGITEIEKRCKAVGVKVNDVLIDCLEVKHGQPVLVAESDKRDEFVPEASASEDFA